MKRWLVSAAFIVCGLVAVVCAGRSGPTWLSIWAGVATSSFAAALVDIVALIERRRQARPVRRLIGRRIGRLHQILLQMVSTVFDDVTCEAATQWPAALRSISERAEDFGTQALAVYPPRTRRDWLRDLWMSLEDALEELTGLTAAGVLSTEVDAIDTAIRVDGFIVLVRDVVPTPNSALTGRTVLASQAASLLEGIQRLLPAAKRAAGGSWIYGD